MRKQGKFMTALRAAGASTIRGASAVARVVGTFFRRCASAAASFFRRCAATVGAFFRRLLHNDASAPRRPLIKRIFAVLFALLSLFCLVYWLLCGIFAGFGISVLWIWLLAAAFFLVLSLWVADAPPFRRLRRRRWLRITVSLLTAALFIYFVFVECLVMSGMSGKVKPELDYIIVLGAKVNGTVPSLPLYWRIERAYEYLEENPDTVVIVSGGQGADETISEAECMRRELTERGITPERILVESESTSTAENMAFSYALIDDENAAVGVVTNNYHVWRAVQMAEDISGGNVCGISAPYPNLLVIHYMVREFLSVTLNRLTGKM